MKIKTNRPFGIELECAYVPTGITRFDILRHLQNAGLKTGLTSADALTAWIIKDDGSLPTGGFELTSPKLVGDNGLEQIEKVSNILKKLTIRINSRCGLHVHVDASDLNSLWLENLLKRYWQAENKIDGFMIKSRRLDRSGFCKSIGPVVQAIESGGKIEPETPIEKLIQKVNIVNPTTKNWKVNINAYNEHKTIEFRQHGGTIDSNKINPWIIFCVNLLETSKVSIITQPEEEVTHIDSSNQPPETDKKRKNAIEIKYKIIAKLLDEHRGKDHFATFSKFALALGFVDNPTTDISINILNEISNYISKFRKEYQVEVFSRRGLGYYGNSEVSPTFYTDIVTGRIKSNTDAISVPVTKKLVTTTRTIKNVTNSIYDGLDCFVVSYFEERTYELNT